MGRGIGVMTVGGRVGWGMEGFSTLDLYMAIFNTQIENLSIMKRVN